MKHPMQCAKCFRVCRLSDSGKTWVCTICKHREKANGGQAVSDHIADVNKMVSDTPRTDAGLEYDDTTVDDVKDFARQLERELNAANQIIRQQQLLEEDNLRLTAKVAQLYQGAEEQKQRIKRLDEENLRMLDYIKQLEEGGDRAILNSYFPDRLTIWTKAKEAKL